MRTQQHNPGIDFFQNLFDWDEVCVVLSLRKATRLPFLAPPSLVSSLQTQPVCAATFVSPSYISRAVVIFIDELSVRTNMNG